MTQKLAYRGVTFQRALKTNPWKATILRCGINLYLGSYATAEQAARAYDNGSFHLQNFARHKQPSFNFPVDYHDSEAPGRPMIPHVVKAIELLRKRFPDEEKRQAGLESMNAADRLEKAADEITAKIIHFAEDLRTEIRVAAGKLRMFEASDVAQTEEIARLERTVKGLQAMGGQQLFQRVGGEVVPATPVEKHLAE